jgi:hypothetical protein
VSPLDPVESPSARPPAWAVVITSPDQWEAGLRGRIAPDSASVTVVKVGHADSRDELVSTIASAFDVPHEIRGLDAILSVLSDLEWHPLPSGFVFVLRDLDGLHEKQPRLFRDLIKILPPLVDRWRTRGVPFQVVLVGTERVRREAKEVMAQVERAFRDSPWPADYRPVVVVDLQVG